MKQKFLVIMLAALFTASAHAEDTFTGQKKAACEAIMCLSTGSPPHECKDSLKKYFKVMVKSSLGAINPKKTLEARKNFLKICPTGDDSVIDQVNTSKNVKEYSEWEEVEVFTPPPKSQACLDLCKGHSECLAKASICQ